MGRGHAGHHLQQPAPLSERAQGIDAEPAPAHTSLGHIEVEHQLAAVASLHADEGAIHTAEVDVAHGIELHLLPEPPSQLVGLVQGEVPLLEGEGVELVDHAGGLQP